MRVFESFSVGAFSCLVALVAYAQSATPSLANKTCRGTFRVPSANASPLKGMGGFQHRFAGTDTALSGHIWRAWGVAAFNRLAAEVDAKRLSSDMTDLEDMGDITNIVVDGRHVTYKSAAGAKYDLIFDAGQLVGTVDPRGVPGQEKFVIANVRMFCE